MTEGSTTVAYVYDAEQQRLKQTTGSSVVRYLNDPASGIGSEYHSDGGGTWHDYLFAEGRRVGLRVKPAGVPASWQAYVPDHLGSVAVVTDGAGAVLQRLAYDAWGLRRNPNGTDDTGGSLGAPTSRGYTDHEHLPVVGLINMNARLYDPELGRFLSADSYIPELFDSQALNRYSYVYNNPLRYTDPSGHAGWEQAGSIGQLPLPSLQTVIVMSALNVLLSLWGDDDDLPPPLLHWPGLASVNEDMQASPRLHDVSRSAGFQSMEAGWSAWGGYKYNVLSKYALSHTLADNYEHEDDWGYAGGRPVFVVDAYGGIPYQPGEETGILIVFGILTPVDEIAAIGWAGRSFGKLNPFKWFPVTKKAPEITTPYKRPSGATTQAQRQSVQNKPCVDCGNTANRQVADHKKPLVQEYYETGAINRTKMRSLDSVQPQCPTCSARQGAEMSRYSRQKKEELGL